MSKETYESYIPETQRDIMKIESSPQTISYSNLYNTKDIKKVQEIFVVIPVHSEEKFNKGIIYVLNV